MLFVIGKMEYPYCVNISPIVRQKKRDNLMAIPSLFSVYLLCADYFFRDACTGCRVFHDV
ncbi:MAG: hypothetical protein JWM14_2067 [Chitinophagaceae bacterium]|nr:hypothetical protein [Chitinophagaceae bacterium]